MGYLRVPVFFSLYRLETVTQRWKTCAGLRNKNVEEVKGLIRKTITLHVHHTFLRMFLLTLRDYNVKLSFKALYRGRKPGEHANLKN